MLGTRWLSRDEFTIGPASWICVWDSCPKRMVWKNGVVSWISHGTPIAALRVDECMDQFGVVPDDGRMLIRVG